MAITAQFLRNIMAEARPIIERQMNDAKLIAGFRDVVANNGGDWGALKALIKAHVEDENDEAGEGKRVKKIVDKADDTAAYADMLGLANMNENNFSDGQSYAAAKGALTVSAEETARDITARFPTIMNALHASETGEITEHEQPETAQEFHPPVTASDGHEGDPSPTLGEKDLVEVGTGHNCAVLPQEPYKAPISNPQPFPSPEADKPEAVSPPAVSGALSADDVPAFLKRDHAPKPAGDKPNCLKLKDGHCKIGFTTSALCAECNAAKSRVSA